MAFEESSVVLKSRSDRWYREKSVSSSSASSLNKGSRSPVSLMCAFNNGFTLISLLMTLTIIGIMAAIAIPGWQELGGVKAGAAARRVMSDLRYAQDLSIMVRKNHSVVFSGSGYQISRAGAGVIEDPSYRGETFVVDLAAEFPGIGVTASFGGGSTVTFDTKGGTSAGGSVVLALGGKSVTVLVQAGTGRISY